MKFRVDEKISLAFISLNFFREDEPEMTYGAACLKDTFDSGNSVDDKMDVFTFDMEGEKDMQAVANKIKNSVNWQNYNFIAFSNFAWCEKVFNTLSLICDFSEKTVLMGGAMVAGSESELEEKYPYVDYFLYSFGEEIFSDLRKNLSKKHIFKMPDFSKLKSPYLTGTIALDKPDMTVRMETRRGCPFDCAYCRHRGIRPKERQIYMVGDFERYKKELELFKEKRVKKINIIDPTFNTREKTEWGNEFRIEFLKLLDELNMDAKISLQIRAEFLDDNFIEAAAKIKRIVFEIGIQSFEPKVLEAIRRKNQTKELVIEKIRKCQEHGIKIEATLIYNLPLQSKDSHEEDKKLLRELNVEPVCFPLQLYPGTELANKVEEYGLVVKENIYGIPEVEG